MKKLIAITGTLMMLLMCISVDTYAQWTKTGSNIYPTTLTDRVGIGTASPAFQFHVRGAGIQTFEVESTDDQVAWSLDNTGTNGKTIRFRTSGATKGAIQMPGNTEHLTFQTGGVTERMRITSTGNVGIGTTSPSELLDVSGAIRIGTTASTNSGAIRFTGSDFEGYNGSTWRSFTAGDDWGVQTVSSDASLAGDGTSGDPLKLAIISDASMSGVGTAGDPLKMDAETDNTLTGLGTVASPLKIAAQGAGANDILVFDGATWLPSALDLDILTNDTVGVADTVLVIADFNAGLGLEVAKLNASGSAAWFHTDDPGNAEPVVVIDHFFDGSALKASILDPAATSPVMEIAHEGLGHAIYARNPGGGGSADVVAIENNGPASGLGIAAIGASGQGMDISLTDLFNPDMAVKITNAGLGSGMRIENLNSSNAVSGLYVEQNGTESAGEFYVDNASNTAYAVEAFVSSGSGDAVLAKTDGTGGALRALNLDPGAPTVFIENSAADATTDVLEVRGSSSDDTYSGTYLFSVTNLTSSLNNAAFIGGKIRVAGDATFDREISVAGDITAENLVVSGTGNINAANGDLDTLTSDCITTDKIQVGTAPLPLDSGYIASVDGKLICEEVRVELSSSWPDYVFAKDYKLMPLSELKQSIEKNSHLPGIPSAKVAEKEGIELGAMNSKLLEKIEELTLYVIELQEQIDQLKADK